MRTAPTSPVDSDDAELSRPSPVTPKLALVVRNLPTGASTEYDAVRSALVSRVAVTATSSREVCAMRRETMFLL